MFVRVIFDVLGGRCMKKSDLKAFVIIYILVISISFVLVAGIDRLKTTDNNYVITMNR